MNSYQFREFTIRPDMIAALQRYLNEGIPTGGFLRAVLANDFQEIVAHADDDNMKQLPAYAAYVYNEIPHNCHGSYEKVDAWIETRRNNE